MEGESIYFRNFYNKATKMTTAIACQISYKTKGDLWVSMVCTRPNLASVNSRPFEDMYIIGDLITSKQKPIVPNGISLSWDAGVEEVFSSKQ